MSSFGSFGLFGAKSLILTKLFQYTNFFLFSAVSVENRQTYVGAMSKAWQEVAAQRCCVGHCNDLRNRYKKFQPQKV